MFDENKILRTENKSMRNLIDCLVDKDSLQFRLWELEWSFFFTVAYQADRNKNLVIDRLMVCMSIYYQNTVMKLEYEYFYYRTICQ